MAAASRVLGEEDVTRAEREALTTEFEDAAQGQDALPRQRVMPVEGSAFMGFTEGDADGGGHGAPASPRLPPGRPILPFSRWTVHRFQCTGERIGSWN
jgi:hypothetical protein